MNDRKRYWTCFALMLTLALQHFMQKPLRDAMALAAGAENLFQLMSGSLAGSCVLALTIFHLGKTLSNKVILIGLMCLSVLTLSIINFINVHAPFWPTLYFICYGSFQLCLLSVAWHFIGRLLTGIEFLRIFPAFNLAAIAGPALSTLFELQQSIVASAIVMLLIAILIATQIPQQLDAAINQKLKTSGALILLYTFLYTTMATVLYFFLLKSASGWSGNKVAFFAAIEITCNMVAFILSVAVPFVRSDWQEWILLPLIAFGILINCLINASVFPVIMGVMIFRIAKNGIRNTKRELPFYTSQNHRSLALKNIQDTVIYRLGDIAGASLVMFFPAANASGLLWVMLPISISWIIIGFHLSNNFHVN